jgi:hypothetical protein
VEPACKPDSVHRTCASQTTCPGGRIASARRRNETATIYLCGLPGGCFGRLAVRRNERATRASCLALLRTGFTEPHRSPDALVSSYLTFSPLLPRRGAGAVSFLWHFPRVAPPGISPAFCPTESGLSSTGPQYRRSCRGRPADSTAPLCTGD